MIIQRVEKNDYTKSCQQQIKGQQFVSVSKKRYLLRYILHPTIVKGIVLPKTRILTLFTQPQVVLNPHEVLSSAEHYMRYFEKLPH